MADKIEDLIKEIAVRHGVAVGRDDPIMILHTLNDLLMKESTEAQQQILDSFKSELEEIAHRWGDDAKNKAERTLSAALTASKEAMGEAVKESATATATATRKEIEGVIAEQLKPAIKETRRASVMNLVAAGMTVFAAGLALWASLG